MANRRVQPNLRKQAKKNRQAYVALSKNIRNQGPKVSYAQGGNCRIKHREYWMDIAGSTNFTSSEGAAINAGNGNVNPWLNRMAGNYEFYKFHSFKICYEPQCSTTTSGYVLITVDYDTNDPAPQDKQQAMAYKGSVRAAPWTSCEFICDKADLSRRKSYFTRPATSGSELALYNVGRIFVCTGGNPVGQPTLGELYVEYEVELITPQQRASSENLDGQVYFGEFDQEEEVDVSAPLSGDYANQWTGNMQQILEKVSEDTVRFKADYEGILSLNYTLDDVVEQYYTLSGIASALLKGQGYDTAAGSTPITQVWEIVANKGQEMLLNSAAVSGNLLSFAMLLAANKKTEL